MNENEKIDLNKSSDDAGNLNEIPVNTDNPNVNQIDLSNAVNINNIPNSMYSNPNGVDLNQANNNMAGTSSFSNPNGIDLNQANNNMGNTNDFSNANNFNAAGNYNPGINAQPVNTTATAPAPKKKKGLLVGLVIAIVLVLAGVFAFLFFFTTAFKTPKQKVMLAFSKTLGNQSLIAELSNNTKENISKDVINDTKNPLDTANKFLLDSGKVSSQSGFDVQLDQLVVDGEEMYEEAYGAGLSMSQITDYDERLALFNTILKYNGTDLLDFDFIFDDDTFIVASEDFLDGYVSVNTETLGEDIIDSYFGDNINSEELADTIEQISFNIFDLAEEAIEKANEKASDADSELAKNVTDAVKNLYDGVVVEKTKPFSFARYSINDKDVKAYAYLVTIPEDVTDNFIDEIIPIFTDEYEKQLRDRFELIGTLDSNMDVDEYVEEYLDKVDELAEQLKDATSDLTFKAYIDNKCRLIAVKYDEDIEGSNEDINVKFEMNFTGYPYLCDKINANLTLCPVDDEDAEPIELLLSYNSDNNKDARNDVMNISINMDGEEKGYINYDYSYDFKSNEYALDLAFCADDNEVDITSEGTVTFEDNTYELDFDDFTLNVDDGGYESSFSLSGSYYLTTDIDDIELPDDPEYAILEMDETELNELLLEMMEKAQSSPLYEFIQSYN